MKYEIFQNILKNKLNFTPDNLDKLNIFVDSVIKKNKHYNLISKSSEKDIWSRHVLDSAQLVDFIDFSGKNSLSDLGSGAGFPGLILSIFNKNPNFHVKLYEKSIVKCNFLKDVIKKLNIRALVMENNYAEHEINSKYIVSRAFKKLPEIIRISREKANKPHTLIILKGKNAQEEIKKASKEMIYRYKLVNSITEKESKILIVNVS